MAKLLIIVIIVFEMVLILFGKTITKWINERANKQFAKYVYEQAKKQKENK